MIKWIIKKFISGKVTSLLQDVSDDKMGKIRTTAESWISKANDIACFSKGVLEAVQDKVLTEEEVDSISAEAAALISRLLDKEAK